jgi:SWI/SNF-related matrix-associated actin-dependent regulator of chromatin subfamily A3
MMHLRKSALRDHRARMLMALRTEAKGLLLKFQTRKTKTGENAYSHLLEVLLRMRQGCNHWTLCGEDRISRLMEILGDQHKLVLNNENRGHLQDLLQIAIDQQEVSVLR